jgi:hypothetical protein
VPHGDGWANPWVRDRPRVSKTYGSKAEAQADGQRMAETDMVEHIIRTGTERPVGATDAGRPGPSKG